MPIRTKICGSLLAVLLFTQARAGSVVGLKDNSENDGKMMLGSISLHVETGTTPLDLALGDILEADFAEAPFHLDYFSSRLSPDQLPAAWKAQDIGNPPVPGKSSYAKGILTLTGSGVDLQRKENEDAFFFAGLPWKGDGQLVARIDEPTPCGAGPMVRDSLDPVAALFGAEMGNGGGEYLYRYGPGGHVSWAGLAVNLPTWFRLDLRGPSIDLAVSPDGVTWESINQTYVKIATDHDIGFFVRRSDQVAGTAVLDHMTFTPPAAEPGTLPQGILLTSGSFLAGDVQFLNPNGGSMIHNGKPFPLLWNQVAAVIAHPITTQQLAEASARQGMILKNGDFLEADIQNIQGNFFEINSLVLGISSYYGTTTRACSLRPVSPVASDYEVRLKDGSIIKAKAVNVADGVVTLSEVSGVTFTVSPDEIAQFRAGSKFVQNLIELPLGPNTDTWEGPNGEQIIVAASGGSIDFPLGDKFNALCLRVGVSPDSPAAAQATVRVLADGREIGRTPALKNGDAPVRINVKLQNPRKLTLAVDSTVPGTRVLLIDPVAVRASEVP